MHLPKCRSYSLSVICSDEVASSVDDASPLNQLIAPPLELSLFSKRKTSSSRFDGRSLSPLDLGFSLPK